MSETSLPQVATWGWIQNQVNPCGLPQPPLWLKYTVWYREVLLSTVYFHLFAFFFGIYMTNNISCYAVNCTFPKRLCTGFSEWILLFVHLLASGTSALNLLSLSWSAADASGCKKTDFIEVYGRTALSSCSVTSVHSFLITLFVQLLVSYHIA